MQLWLMLAILIAMSCKRCTRLGSRLQGHPERPKTPGMETTNGPLGKSGLSQAAGMALALRMEEQNIASST